MTVLTKAYIDRNRTKKGAWTRKQLEAIGVSWPPRHGWKDRVVGNVISHDAAKVFEAGCGNYRDADQANFRIDPPMVPTGAVSRIYLECPFRDKDDAKALGARWDNAKRAWFITEFDDFTLFMRWIPKTANERLASSRTIPKPVSDRHPTKTTGTFKPICNCDVLPWVECEHTAEWLASMPKEAFA